MTNVYVTYADGTSSDNLVWDPSIAHEMFSAFQREADGPDDGYPRRIVSVRYLSEATQ